MTARVLDFATSLQCLVAGLAALLAGALTFLTIALIAMLSPGVSGSWLALPCAVMVMGVAMAGAWLVFSQGAQRIEPMPMAEQEWHWRAQPR